MKHGVKETAKKGAELWAAKKGLEWTGSLLKWGVIVGLGYLAYTYIRDNQDEIEESLSDLAKSYGVK